MSLFVFAALLLLTSCSKEEMLSTELAQINPIESVEKIDQHSKNQTIYNIASADGNSVPVSKISSEVVGEELIVDFSSSHNFTDADLAATQTIDFVDGSGKVSTLTFEVISYTGGNGDLQANFTIGGNDLSGLTIVVAQQIVIEDVIME